MRKKVLVAMSGGVDSSVSALLLKEQGYRVTGVTMCLGPAGPVDSQKTKCRGKTAIEDAKKVCSRLEIPHYVLDFSKDIEKEVISDFVSEYSKGRTPNPCVRCNQYLKFGKLLSYAKKMGFDFLSTGHYAKIAKKQKEFFLTRPKDRKRDQTYFLYRVSKDDLKFILFPLSEYTKEEVRKIAKNVSLPVAKKPQSQDICFVSKGRCKEFVSERIKKRISGDIVDKDNNILGKHRGVFNYTIGQRGGLGVSFNRPLYVVDLDGRKNRVVVGGKEDLKSKNLAVSNLNRLSGSLSGNLSAKIRYAHKPASCKIIEEKGKVSVLFDEPQESITPGQSIVFYDNDIVLGGGIIEKFDDEYKR